MQLLNDCFRYLKKENDKNKKLLNFLINLISRKSDDLIKHYLNL